MDPDVYRMCYHMQDQSFWYKSRNRLIADLVKRHFSGALAVLDIGCGTGYVLPALQMALPSSRLVAGDSSMAALRYAARRTKPNVELRQMDCWALPFAAEFDLVCALDVLEHMEEDDLVLAEMRRTLRAGGGILLSVPQHPFLWSEADVIKRHKRRYRCGELEEKCRRAGFDVIASTSFVTTLLPAMLLQRLGRARRPQYNVMAEHALPRWLSQLFEMALNAERRAIGFGVSLPVGGSRFIVAQIA
jgi:SAM-dependent methyltransferase